MDLDDGNASWADGSRRDSAAGSADTPGAGAAGGVGFALLAHPGPLPVASGSGPASTW